MPNEYISECDIKRKIRNLKKLEMKLRFNQMDFSSKNAHSCPSNPNIHNKKMVWDDFFDLRNMNEPCVKKETHALTTKQKIEDNKQNIKKARYYLNDIMHMSKDEFKSVISEFHYAVFYQIYKETGMINMNLYNPDILLKLGLPFDADEKAIKSKFRELAKKYHPDAGGDKEKFNDLLEQFNALHMK